VIFEFPSPLKSQNNLRWAGDWRRTKRSSSLFDEYEDLDLLSSTQGTQNGCLLVSLFFFIKKKIISHQFHQHWGSEE
jgi:hypothetical protein